MRTPSGTLSREIVTGYELTLLSTVAVGEIVAILPVTCAPASAAQVTRATWPVLSCVASASAKVADTCILVRSASWTKPVPVEVVAPLWPLPLFPLPLLPPALLPLPLLPPPALLPPPLPA